MKLTDLPPHIWCENCAVSHEKAELVRSLKKDKPEFTLIVDDGFFQPVTLDEADLEGIYFCMTEGWRRLGDGEYPCKGYCAAETLFQYASGVQLDEKEIT